MAAACIHCADNRAQSTLQRLGNACVFQHRRGEGGGGTSFGRAVGTLWPLCCGYIGGRAGHAKARGRQLPVEYTNKWCGGGEAAGSGGGAAARNRGRYSLVLWGIQRGTCCTMLMGMLRRVVAYCQSSSNRWWVGGGAAGSGGAAAASSKGKCGQRWHGGKSCGGSRPFPHSGFANETSRSFSSANS
jgi:hypothetical protein